MPLVSRAAASLILCPTPMSLKLPLSAPAQPLTPIEVLGLHPTAGTWLGDMLDHADGSTAQRIAHRTLSTRGNAFPRSLVPLQDAVLTHHASAVQLQRSQDAQQAFASQGMKIPKSLRRIPVDDTTRKGNFTEVVLAEYIRETGKMTIPVYRLRHNPNIDQSMKGDDVLAFDLDANPVRIVVGEAKFRKTSAAAVVREIVSALETSHDVGVPASLQFVADEVGDDALAQRVMACARLYAEGNLRVDYVGLLLSDTNAPSRIHGAPATSLHRLLLVSWGMEQPDILVESCLSNLG